jgi:DNA-binding LacI/PurR family transcriptional regulator
MTKSFQSLSAQMADTLREQLRAGAWGTTLPGERQLAKHFSVSRKTTGKAIAMLRAEGVIRTSRGKSSALVTEKIPPPTAKAPDRVVLLLPEPIDQSRPFMVYWLNNLTTLMHNVGVDFELVIGWRYFGSHAGRSLQQLVDSHPAKCWILVRSPCSLQQWFADNGVPAVVAGSPLDDIKLPSVDLDHRAIVRHAALTLLREGHRRLAYVFEKTRFGGTVIGEQAFRETIAEYDSSATPGICRPAMNAASIINELRRIHNSSLRPTAYMMGNSFSYVTAQSWFNSQQLSVPGDISLISHDEDPFLPFLHPTPARYAIGSAKFANTLYKAVRRVMDHGAGLDFKELIIPDYVKGASVGPPPSTLREAGIFRRC